MFSVITNASLYSLMIFKASIFSARGIIKVAIAVFNFSSAASKSRTERKSELMRMNQNAMTHTLETQMVSGMLQKMRAAITGNAV